MASAPSERAATTGASSVLDQVLSRDYCPGHVLCHIYVYVYVYVCVYMCICVYVYGWPVFLQVHTYTWLRVQKKKIQDTTRLAKQNTSVDPHPPPAPPVDPFPLLKAMRVGVA